MKPGELQMQKYRLATLLVLLGYTVFLAYLMLFGFGRYPYTDYSYNLVPFATIRHFLNIDRFNTTTWVVNLIGNIGVFIPFGILLPAVGMKQVLKAYRIFLIALIALELAQLISKRGSLDIDDVILNSLGFWMGYLIYCAGRAYIFDKGAKRNDTN